MTEFWLEIWHPLNRPTRILYRRSYLWHTGGKCSNMLTIFDLRDTCVWKKLLRKYDSSITGPIYELMCVHILRDVKRVQNKRTKPHKTSTDANRSKWLSYGEDSYWYFKRVAKNTTRKPAHCSHSRLLHKVDGMFPHERYRGRDGR